MNKVVLFEPWSLGDAVIAAAIARSNPEIFILACDEKWHSLLRSAGLNEGVELLPTSLNYTKRSKDQLYAAAGKKNDHIESRDVLSIRGDFRDWIAAKKQFPNSKIRMNGWLSFFARRIKAIDLLYRCGLLKVGNRYSRWAQLCKVSSESIDKQYESFKKLHQSNLSRKNQNVVIHIGAQWKSRQFPHVSSLKSELESKEIKVEIIAGPNDPIPDGIKESEVFRAVGSVLVEKFKFAALAITNDSGPMHLARFIGTPTLAIERVSNISEWLPPSTDCIISSAAPTGYMADKYYCSDRVLDYWPEAKIVASRVREILNSA